MATDDTSNEIEQINNARGNLTTQRQQVSDYEAQLQAIRAPAKRPQMLSREQHEQMRQTLATGEQNISQANQQLNSYEQDTLIPAESQVKSYQANQDAYNEAVRHVDNGMGAEYMLYGENPLVRNYVKQIMLNQGYTFEPGVVHAPQPIYASRLTPISVGVPSPISKDLPFFSDTASPIIPGFNAPVTSPFEQAAGITITASPVINAPQVLDLTKPYPVNKIPGFTSLPVVQSSNQINTGVKTTTVDIKDQFGNVVGHAMVPLNNGVEDKALNEVRYNKFIVKYATPAVDEISTRLGYALTGIGELPNTAIGYTTAVQRGIGISDELAPYLISLNIPVNAKGYGINVPGIGGYGSTTITAKQISEGVKQAGEGTIFQPITDEVSWLIPTTPAEAVVKVPLEYGAWELLTNGVTESEPELNILSESQTGVKLSPQVTRALLLNKPYSELNDYLTGSYTPTTPIGQYAKGTAESLGYFRFPEFGLSQGIRLGGQFLSDPFGTVAGVENYAQNSPFEFLGLLTGEPLLKQAEVRLSKYRTTLETVSTKDYGDVKIQNIPHYGKVAWIEGELAATEKYDILKQIYEASGKKIRTFVSVSSDGIPLQKFELRKGVGFEVKEISNPMRGRYETSDWEVLRKNYAQAQTTAGAASYYSGVKGERTRLPNPMETVSDLLTGGSVTSQRPFEYLRRTYEGVETPGWIKKATEGLIKEGKIPESSMRVINKYYKLFMDRPIEWEGKTYKGSAKEELLNRINLKNKGDGLKLKVASALTEYQFRNKINFVGGNELLSAIAPYGMERQIVNGIGMRFYAKQFEDLRKAYVPSTMDKILEFITGSKRGQSRVLINGEIVEIQPGRLFSGVSEKTKTIRTNINDGGIIKESSGVTNSAVDSLNNFLTGEERRVERTKPLSFERVKIQSREPAHYLFEERVNTGNRREINLDTNRRELDLNRERETTANRRTTTNFNRREVILPELRLFEERSRSRNTSGGGEERRPTKKQNWVLTASQEKKQSKNQRIREIKKARDYLLEPTGFSVAENIPLLNLKPLSKITGFEIFR